MQSRFGRRGLVPWLCVGLAMSLSGSFPAFAQDPAAAPPLPSPAPPAPGTVASPATAPVADGSREELEARIRQLETMVNQLSGQMQQMSVSGGGVNASSAPDPGTRAGTGTGAPGPGAPGSTADSVTPSASGGASAPGQSLPPNPSANKRFDSPATLASIPGKVKFGPGFEIKTDDNEFFFQFHNLTQFDYRGYQQGGQNPVHDTFDIPRQWFMFSGRITRPVGYFVSLQNGNDTVSGLDMFIDLNYNPKIQGRIGRFKTPFTYEFLVEPIQGLMNPERSIFFNNFGQNRDLGAMAYGRLFANTFDYAVGAFNGNRNGFVAQQDSKFVSAFINWKPFGNAEGSILENFNVGGSVFSGNANHIPNPLTLRTSVANAGNTVLGTPFLTFNNNARETGDQTFWDLHIAWYYKQLAVVSEYAGGAQDYSLTSTPQLRNRLGVNSIYVQTGYLLTGETRSSTGIVKPLRPFDLRKGMRGPGAWELVARVQQLDIDSSVFKSGLADPNNNANRVFQTDFGFNWHMTQYLKLYFDWGHSEFNNPVIYAPGKRQLTADQFTVRFQLYF